MCVLLYMVKKEKYHFEPNQVKYDILDLILKNANPISEPKIREELKNKYGGINQSNVNRPLHWLHEKGCVELEKSRSNKWSIKTLKNLENIFKEFPELVETLQKKELALEIVLDALINALTHSIKPEYMGIAEIKQYIAPIRDDLREKLELSASFFKLCITDEYALYRNLSDLLEISDGGPHAHIFVIDEVPSVFVHSAAGADIAFKACVALDIMKRKGNVRKDMKKEIEYIKQMNNKVSETQLKELKQYYEKLTKELDFIKQMEETDPNKQLEYLKNNYEKILKAPYFIGDKKFVPVHNVELYNLQIEFEKRDGEWEYFKDEE